MIESTKEEQEFHDRLYSFVLPMMQDYAWRYVFEEKRDPAQGAVYVITFRDEEKNKAAQKQLKARDVRVGIFDEAVNVGASLLVHGILELENIDILNFYLPDIRQLIEGFYSPDFMIGIIITDRGMSLVKVSYDEKPVSIPESLSIGYHPDKPVMN